MADDEATSSAASDSSSGGEVQPEDLGAADQNAMQQAWMDAMLGSVIPGAALDDLAQINRIQERANDKAKLAEMLSANTVMRIDPAAVDRLASFCEDKAEQLQDRVAALQELANVEPPGNDPTSTNAARVHGQVAAGDDRAYLENYLKLAKVFDDSAKSLRASATQTRTDDDNSADQFRGDDLA